MARLSTTAPFRHPRDTEVFGLSIPTFFALVSEPLFLLTDSAVVGSLGTAALGGLGVASQILLTFANLCIFLAYGTTAAVSRRFGAGQIALGLRHGIDGVWLAVLITATAITLGWPLSPLLIDALGASPTLSICLACVATAAVSRRFGAGQIALGLRHGIDGVWLAVLIAATAITLGWPLSPLLIDALGASPTVAPYALTYLRISLLSLPGLLIIMAGTGVLRGLQNARIPLFVTVSANLANIVLSMLFVWGLGWGIAGSAWATVVAQSGGA